MTNKINDISRVFDNNLSCLPKCKIFKRGTSWSSEVFEELCLTGGRAVEYNYGVVFYDSNEQMIAQGETMLDLLISLNNYYMKGQR